MTINKIRSQSLTLLLLISFACASTPNTQAQTVYVTKTGTKYHRGTCRYLSHSKTAISLRHAKKEGYSACKVCKPSKAVIPEGNDNLNDSVPNTSEEKNPPINNVIAQQCSATTKSGLRCKRRTKNASGRCWQHE